jgi:hypothetical protein
MRRYVQEAGPFEGNAANGLLYQHMNWRSGLRTTRWEVKSLRAPTYKDMSYQGSTGVPRRQTFARSAVDAGSTMPRHLPRWDCLPLDAPASAGRTRSPDTCC